MASPADTQVPAARLSVRGARAAYVGPGLALAPHTSAVATLAVGLEAPFRLRLGDTDSRTASIALIPPHTHHHLITEGAMAFLYLDATSDDHAPAQSDAHLKARHASLVAATSGTGWDANSLFELVGAPHRPPAPAKLARVLRALDGRPQDFPRLADAATLAGLSESRLRHLLREVTGLTFRRYRRWRRMVAAVRAIAAGGSLTQAAHATGWASSAHFSHAFRLTFGLRPSDMQRTRIAYDLDAGAQ